MARHQQRPSRRSYSWSWMRSGGRKLCHISDSSGIADNTSDFVYSDTSGFSFTQRYSSVSSFAEIDSNACL
jgi:hypothetical protein